MACVTSNIIRLFCKPGSFVVFAAEAEGPCHRRLRPRACCPRAKRGLSLCTPHVGRAKYDGLGTLIYNYRIRGARVSCGFGYEALCRKGPAPPCPRHPWQSLARSRYARIPIAVHVVKTRGIDVAETSKPVPSCEGSMCAFLRGYLLLICRGATGGLEGFKTTPCSNISILAAG